MPCAGLFVVTAVPPAKATLPMQQLATLRGASSAGNGVVVHQSDTLGLVVVDRNTVAVGAGDVRLTFGAAPAEADAAIRFLHPMHNFALLSYDPLALPPEVRCPSKPAPLPEPTTPSSCTCGRAGCTRLAHGRLAACGTAEEGGLCQLHTRYFCV